MFRARNLFFILNAGLSRTPTYFQASRSNALHGATRILSRRCTRASAGTASISIRLFPYTSYTLMTRSDVLTVKGHDLRAVDLLLQAGAAPCLRTRIDNCETPREMAEKAGLREIAEMLAVREARLGS